MVQSSNLIAWTYTDDNGDDYRMAAKKAITDQQNGALATKVGGSAAASTVPRLPKHIKPRRRYVVSAGGVRRAVVCYDRTCDLWAVDATTITLVTGGADTSFTRTNTFFNERSRDTTTQSA